MGTSDSDYRGGNIISILSNFLSFNLLIFFIVIFFQIASNAGGGCRISPVLKCKLRMEQKRGRGGGGGGGGTGGGGRDVGGVDGGGGQLRAWREPQFARDIRGAPGEFKNCKLLSTLSSGHQSLKP